MSEKPRNDEMLKDVSYEIEDPISDKTIEEIIRFTNDQREVGKLSGNKDHMSHSTGFAWNSLTTMRYVKGMEDRTKSFVVIARDKSHEMVGYTSVSMAETDQGIDVPAAFVCVRFDSLRKGIAVELIRQRHELLRQKGVESYRVSVHEGSKGVIEKAVGHEIRPYPGDETGTKFIVDLEA